MKKYMLEVCADSVESVLNAVAGGADRIELCAALSAGGLTPTPGLVCKAVEAGIPVNVLIRLREGDFVYSPDDISVMAADIENLSRYAVNGFVIGALTPDGNIDVEACRRLMAASPGREFTFHRAFDMCRDPFAALEDVIALGCNRILTSGCASNAFEGVDLLAALVERAAGRISIMPGAGVNSNNAAFILQNTGATELHASASRLQPSSMRFRNDKAKMGRADADEFSRKITSPAEVAQIVEAITPALKNLNCK